jgi:hypothetical protein
MADRTNRNEPADPPDDVSPQLRDAGAPVPDRGTTASEGGRVLDVEPSPEGALMHMGTVTTSEPAPVAPDMDREASFEEIDNRAADAARMEVRRREHSAD